MSADALLLAVCVAVCLLSIVGLVCLLFVSIDEAVELPARGRHRGVERASRRGSRQLREESSC